MSPHDMIRAAPVPQWMRAYIERTKEPKTFAQIQEETGLERPCHEVWRALSSAMRDGLIEYHCENFSEYWPVYHPPGMTFGRGAKVLNPFRRPINLHVKKMKNNGKGAAPLDARYPV